VEPASAALIPKTDSLRFCNQLYTALGAHVDGVQYTKRLGLVYTLGRRPCLSQILTLSCATWTEPKDGLHVSRKSALTRYRTCVAGFAYVEAPSLIVYPPDRSLDHSVTRIVRPRRPSLAAPLPRDGPSTHILQSSDGRSRGLD
jgi:hypothetical protein